MELIIQNLTGSRSVDDKRQRLAEFLPLASFSSLTCGEGQSTASRSFSLTGYILLILHVWNLLWM
jgi:hypothetical protein